jgi:hypothetical protein
MLAHTIKETSVSNLSHQFDSAENIEEIQRRRFQRRREYGFVGNGYHFFNYPYMIGAVGAGSVTQTQSEQNENPVQEQNETPQQEAGETANAGTGMGEGGTAAAATGAAGGSPA